LVAVHEPPVSAGGQKPESSASASSRVPALDGLRGFALIGMLLWHAEVTWVQGGFARMTIFFALSGYLATMSWQRVRSRRGGRGGFGTFWWRRARRLLPVSFLGIGVAVAVTALTGTDSMRDRLAGDVLSVLGYVSNLRFWLSGQSYGELFAEASLLQHYWTLSIEEQAFIVLPLLLAGVGLLCRGNLRAAALVVGVLTVVFAGLPAVVEHSPDAVWYSSIVRFGEFCGGVALALWTVSRRDDRRRAPQWALPLAGTLSLASLVAVMLLIPREAAWLYRGGMALVVIPTVILLASAATGAGLASRILAVDPLVRLGRWTFSIYVLHWPLFWIVDGARTGLDGWELASVRLAAAVAIGAVVHVLIERPLMAPGPAVEPAPRASPGERFERVLVRVVPNAWWRTRPAAGALTVTGCMLALVATLPTGDTSRQIEFQPWDDLVEEVEEQGGLEQPVAPAEPDDAEAPEDAEEGRGTVVDDLASEFRIDEAGLDDYLIEIAAARLFVGDEGRIRLAVFGGSVATVLDSGGTDWLHASDDIAIRPGAARLGCGLVNEGERIVAWDGATGQPNIARPFPECGLWVDTWPYIAEMGGIDAALVVVGTWDTMDFELDGIGPSHVGRPGFDDLLESHLETMLSGFRSVGVEQVQLATTPVPGSGTADGSWERRGMGPDHAERIAALNALLGRVAAANDDVEIVRLGEYVDSLDEATRNDMLPDGLHYSPAGADRAWREFVGQAVVETFDNR
jgi:peptidoglycan/LPS O-acetylase OafA/YrhL